VTKIRCSLLFALSTSFWLLITLRVAPSMNGIDSYYFRDAGWNLAAYGSFESAALANMTDLTPRFFSHYPPIMPLLFAVYASIFPRNSYGGTIFNFLIALIADLVGLVLVMRQPPGKLRSLTALALAMLPVTFVTNDRPEALGLTLGSLAVATAALKKPRPLLTGAMLAVAFLAHPFTAVIAAIWVAALFCSEAWGKMGGWQRALRLLFVAASSSLMVLACVALTYYSIDPTSLSRFLQHASGADRGIGWLHVLSDPKRLVDQLCLHVGAIETVHYVLSYCGLIGIAVWAWIRRKELGPREWFPLAASLLCLLCTIFIFPSEPAYPIYIGVFVPYCLLIANRDSGKLGLPSMALLLFVMLIGIPSAAISLIQRVEQYPSYLAAKDQPAYLLSKLKSPEDVVAVEWGSYDIYKPIFHHMVFGYSSGGKDGYKNLAAVANCYQAFHGDDKVVRPLPAQLNPADYRLIQRAPQHLWITLFGQRIMSGQWGYGCDLYVRDGGPDVRVANVPTQTRK